MIKAEIITHEGTRGPNWLDQCKAMATPWSVSLVVVLLAITLVFVTMHNRQQVGQASQQTTSTVPAVSLSPLSVQPPTTGSALQTGTNSVQSAAGGNAGSSDTAASQISAGSTPSLNTAKTPAASTSTSQLTETTQGVIQPVQSTVNNALQNINKPLGNLGL